LLGRLPAHHGTGAARERFHRNQRQRQGVSAFFPRIAAICVLSAHSDEMVSGGNPLVLTESTQIAARPAFHTPTEYNPAKGFASIPTGGKNNCEQNFVFRAGWCNLSHRRGRSRLAAGLKMGGGYCGLAGSDVGECGCFCHSIVSCVRGLSEGQLEFSRIAHVKQSDSFQLGVLGFRSNEDENIGVGIFPEREKILIRRTGFGGVTLHGVGSADLKMRECSEGYLFAGVGRNFIQKLEDLVGLTDIDCRDIDSQ